MTLQGHISEHIALMSEVQAQQEVMATIPPEQQAMMQQAQAGQQAAAPAPPPPGGDTIATGALPPGTEPPSPVGGPGALSDYPGFAGAPAGFEGAPFPPPGS